MEVLMAVSFHRRLEAKHGVYLEKVKRQGRKGEEDERQSWRGTCVSRMGTELQ